MQRGTTTVFASHGHVAILDDSDNDTQRDYISDRDIARSAVLQEVQGDLSARDREVVIDVNRRAVLLWQAFNTREVYTSAQLRDIVEVGLLD
jgi:hypothetical protein